MSSTKEYASEKIIYSYKLIQEGRLFEKGRACIVKDGKVLVLEHDDTKKRCLPGGGVDFGETVFECVKREAYEETGYEVEPICIITEHYYDVPMNYQGKDFISKRVEYIYLCKVLNHNGLGVGVQGEFACEINQLWLNIDELINIRLNKHEVEKIKKLASKYNLI